LLFFRTTLLLGCALCLMAQSDEEYAGPAILSRGETPVLNPAAPIAFRPYVGLSGIYDNGLIPVSVTSTGQIPVTDGYGVELNLGLYGYKVWKHTTLGLNYRGDFRDYSQKTYYDGSDHFLALTLAHEPTKHVKFTLRNQVGTYSQNYFLSSFDYLSTNYLQVPQNDIYDNRVIFLSTAGDVTYQESARLSFDAGGEGDLVRRQSSALYGVTQGSAHGDVQYRITRHTTLGADYRFTHYDFTRGFGYSNIHSVGINYSARFSRNLQLSARIGGARVDGLNLVEVPIDPAIAVLIGQTVGIQAAHHLGYSPDITARLTDTYQHSTFGLSYGNSVNPGNGVYLTSKMQIANASYSYTGVRNWNFGMDANYSRLSALIQTLGAYSSYGGGVGATRMLGKGLHLVMRVDAHHYDVSGQQFLHTEYRASLGLNWSPGDVPLSIW
jgi:hypothetical protein